MIRSKRHLLGQHFLVNKSILQKIVAAIKPASGDTIIEIGAGRGALTLPLAQQVKKVIAVEKDLALASELRQLVPDNVQVLCQDVLTVDFIKIKNDLRLDRMKLIGNLPYSISGPFLFKILEERESFESAVFLLQREVAERLLAKPGSKKYAPLSILFAIFFDLKILFRVSPHSFSPPPEVQSSVIEVRKKLVPRFELNDEMGFRRFLKTAFKERRKKLWKNLSGYAEKSNLESAYAGLGLEKNLRAEQLPVESFVKLFNFLKNCGSIK